MMKELLADAHHRLMVEWAAHADKLGDISQHDFCTHAIAALRPILGELAEIKEDVRLDVHDGGDFNWAEANVLIRQWREDAERYQWLRSAADVTSLFTDDNRMVMGGALDSAIDAARATAAAERG